uniref:integrase core domain-containing protein n=1 Tax=uncultured Micrococcus sp. TaxID=114051 RepID=UPI00262977A6
FFSSVMVMILTVPLGTAYTDHLTRPDNSLAESFNAALKRELLEGRAAFPDQATAYRAVFRWANRYNTRRRHSTIGQVSPNSYENAYNTARSATLTEAA